MDGKALLEDLDAYLRAIWLECCGHMSEFSIGPFSGEPLDMGLKVDRLFDPGFQCDHVYDFGTCSETIVKVLDVREGKGLTPNPIALLARNSPPAYPCVDCGKPATWLCVECHYEAVRRMSLRKREGRCDLRRSPESPRSPRRLWRSAPDFQLAPHGHVRLRRPGGTALLKTN